MIPDLRNLNPRTTYIPFDRLRRRLEEQKKSYPNYEISKEIARLKVEIQELLKEQERKDLLLKDKDSEISLLKKCIESKIRVMQKQCRIINRLKDKLSIKKEQDREERVESVVQTPIINDLEDAPAQLKVLEAINQNCLSFSQLCEHTGYNKGRLSRILSKLFQKNKICKRKGYFELVDGGSTRQSTKGSTDRGLNT